MRLVYDHYSVGLPGARKFILHFYLVYSPEFIRFNNWLASNKLLACCGMIRGKELGNSRLFDIIMWTMNEFSGVTRSSSVSDTL